VKENVFGSSVDLVKLIDVLIVVNDFPFFLGKIINRARKGDLCLMKPFWGSK